MVSAIVVIVVVGIDVLVGALLIVYPLIVDVSGTDVGVSSTVVVGTENICREKLMKCT